ncbi:hypothetical protein KC571_03085 [candidate division WWE3 bacterium]|uniref:ZIP family metal transporter n=1 Tax=candidate division WWE3 bacterium TaxID=2053526 RepID=A0A955LH57_UNCKA|nr:hypothetical protein [candidate division WWE3 bacterium]
MNRIVLALIPAALIFSHLLGFLANIKDKQDIEQLRSFAAGFSVGYVFLILIPDVYSFPEIPLLPPTALTLLGFIFFHLSHKFVFQIRDVEAHKIALLDEIHLLTAGLYNFLISFTLVELMKIKPLEAFIVAVILTLHTILVDITHAETSRRIPNYLKVAIIFMATLMGGAFAIFELLNSVTTTILFSLTAGAIIYISIREEIPNDTKGNPALFLLGAGIILAIVVILL